MIVFRSLKAEGTNRPEGASVFKVPRFWFLVYRPETPGIKAQGTEHRAWSKGQGAEKSMET